MVWGVVIGVVGTIGFVTAAAAVLAWWAAGEVR